MIEERQNQFLGQALSQSKLVEFFAEVQFVSSDFLVRVSCPFGLCLPAPDPSSFNCFSNLLPFYKYFSFVALTLHILC